MDWRKGGSPVHEINLMQSEHLLLYGYKNSDPSSCPYIHLNTSSTIYLQKRKKNSYLLF